MESNTRHQTVIIICMEKENSLPLSQQAPDHCCTEHIPITYLSTEIPLHKAGDVCVWPLGAGPGLHLRQVSGEVDCLQLVVDKLADVPGEVVMAENRVKWAKNYDNLTEQKINKSNQEKSDQWFIFDFVKHWFKWFFLIVFFVLSVIKITLNLITL